MNSLKIDNSLKTIFPLFLYPFHALCSDEADTGSGPNTPKTPLSANSGNEKLPGYRPRLSSMQTRLDHTKIDTTLYQKV
jgi:hypothetical protein